MRFIVIGIDDRRGKRVGAGTVSGSASGEGCSVAFGDSMEAGFSAEVREIIASHRLFSGGRRHHEIVAEMLPEGSSWVEIKAPISEVFEQYRELLGVPASAPTTASATSTSNSATSASTSSSSNSSTPISADTGATEIVVFASGDPLFFGFANTIKRELPNAEIIIYPTFNSLQRLAHKLLLPYGDMHTISLTGRGWSALDEAVISGERMIGALTDGKRGPRKIAERLLDYGYDNYTIYVGEMLGNAECERVRKMELSDAVREEFSMPNCVILEKSKERYRHFGIPDSEFLKLDGRERMITKMPIRLLTLSALSLHNRHTLWDIGFCTGSVSVEAKLQFPHLSVVAFESRKECGEIMERNAKRLGAPGIDVVLEDFLEADLSALPTPDAIFIGGHGGHIAEFLERIAEYASEGCVVVLNSVTESSRTLFESEVARRGWSLAEPTKIVVDENNPIVVLTAVVKNKK